VHLKTGDIIAVLTKNDSGWWTGLVNNDKIGLFPYSYCTEIEPTVAKELLQKLDDEREKDSEIAKPSTGRRRSRSVGVFEEGSNSEALPRSERINRSTRRGSPPPMSPLDRQNMTGSLEISKLGQTPKLLYEEVPNTPNVLGGLIPQIDLSLDLTKSDEPSLSSENKSDKQESQNIQEMKPPIIDSPSPNTPIQGQRQSMDMSKIRLSVTQKRSDSNHSKIWMDYLGDSVKTLRSAAKSLKEDIKQVDKKAEQSKTTIIGIQTAVTQLQQLVSQQEKKIADLQNQNSSLDQTLKATQNTLNQQLVYKANNTTIITIGVVILSVLALFIVVTIKVY